jgi:DNA-binding NarL/FixJ family response regulator
MVKDQNEVGEGRPLENLGISEAEERVYRWLLEHPASTKAEIACKLALPTGKAQRLIDMIEAKGLATRTLERPSRYVAASPYMAIESLVLKYQKGLQDAILVARDLEKKVVADRRNIQQQLVELVTSQEAELQIYNQMHDAARSEFLSFVRPPFRVSRLDVPVKARSEHQRRAQARGVLYRSAREADCLELPGVLQNTRADMEAGEQVRVTSFLPLKMVISDHRMALIPLDLDQEDGPSLLVRSPALLEALHALFESSWKQATPLSFDGNESLLRTDQSKLDDEIRELISLMAAGINDKALAHDLNISNRTFTRRISQLMRVLNARTRFQAGWAAALLLSGLKSDEPLESD